jgi:hypothetical protein
MPAISKKRTCEAVSALEGVADVNSLIFGDLHIWPLLRWLILVRMARLARDPNVDNEQYDSFLVDSIPQLLKDAAHNFKISAIGDLAGRLHQHFTDAHQVQINYLKELDSIDCVIFDRASLSYESVDGRPFNPIIDPVLEALERNHNPLRIEIGSEFGIESARSRRTIRLNPVPNAYLPMINELRDGKLSKRWTDSSVKGLGEFRQEVSSHIPELGDNQGDYAESVRNVLGLIDFFRDCLGALKPKVVFQVCYYHHQGFALSAVCRELGIPCIDVQHGMYSKYHQYYTHYSDIPEGGYAMLPQYLWVWSEYFKAMASEWAPFGTMYPEAVVGGHPWLTKWRSGYEPDFNELQQKNIDIILKNEKVILVTLQYPPQGKSIIPEPVIEAIQSSPPGWLWVFREHPVTPPDVSAALKEDIIRTGTKSTLVLGKHDLPLPMILRHSNHHVTSSSSCIYEATAFDVPTTFVGREAAWLHAYFIENDLATLVENGTQLIQTIQHEESVKRLSKAPRTIEASPELMQQVVETWF